MIKIKKEKTKASEIKKMTRNKRLTISLNEKEFRVIERFCEKYRIQNRTKFYRETIIKAILRKFEEDSPSLFDETEMR